MNGKRLSIGILIVLLMTVGLMTGCSQDSSSQTSLSNIQPINVSLSSYGYIPDNRDAVRACESIGSKDGWLYFVFELAIKNNNDYAVYRPSSISGTVIDSGGYERTSTTTLIEYVSDTRVYVPGIQNREFFCIHLPQNQVPVTLSVNILGQSYSFDVNSDTVAVNFPFDDMPANIEVKEDYLEYTKPNSYDVRFDFTYNKGGTFLEDDDWTLDLVATVSNTGGNDTNMSLNLGDDNMGDKCSERGPILVVIDSKGRYWPTEFQRMGNCIIVAPGLQKEYYEYFILGKVTNFDWLWVVVIDPTSYKPLAQLKLTP